jgi:hypothetical protein
MSRLTRFESDLYMARLEQFGEHMEAMIKKYGGSDGNEIHQDNNRKAAAGDDGEPGVGRD